ncbi:MAG TPA: acyltransferase family protein [Pseudonocardiaceae bacterium]|nr:acyltransferase family protein [Pseudonocardiaceae bacterium]
MHTAVVGPDGWFEDWRAIIGVSVGMALICLADRVPEWDRWIPASLHRAVQWVAGISYGLYLVHQAIGFLIMRQLQDLGAGPVEQSAAMLAAGLLLGWAAHPVDRTTRAQCPDGLVRPQTAGGRPLMP